MYSLWNAVFSTNCSSPACCGSSSRWAWSFCAGCLLTSLLSLGLSCWWCCAACVRSGSSSWYPRWGRWCGRFSKGSRRFSWLVLGHTRFIQKNTVNVQKKALSLLSHSYVPSFGFPSWGLSTFSLCDILSLLSNLAASDYVVRSGFKFSIDSPAGFHSAPHTNAGVRKLRSSAVCRKARKVQRPPYP